MAWVIVTITRLNAELVSVMKCTNRQKPADVAWSGKCEQLEHSRNTAGTQQEHSRNTAGTQQERKMAEQALQREQDRKARARATFGGFGHMARKAFDKVRSFFSLRRRTV